jgi:hypothetical protein
MLIATNFLIVGVLKQLGRIANALEKHEAKTDDGGSGA